MTLHFAILVLEKAKCFPLLKFSKKKLCVERLINFFEFLTFLVCPQSISTNFQPYELNFAQCAILDVKICHETSGCPNASTLCVCVGVRLAFIG